MPAYKTVITLRKRGAFWNEQKYHKIKWSVIDMHLVEVEKVRDCSNYKASPPGMHGYISNPREYFIWMHSARAKSTKWNKLSPSSKVFSVLVIKMSPFVFLNYVVVTCYDILETICSSRMSEHPIFYMEQKPKRQQKFQTLTSVQFGFWIHCTRLWM